jgi:hypothetical protein
MTHICTVSGSKAILTKNNINPNKTNLVQWSAGVFQIADEYHILGPAVYLPVKINIYPINLKLHFSASGSCH